MMINDPHRAQAVPSLRYRVHLVGPGWNVIGGGEPEIPGVSIGHNEHGAWGLTVFGTDGEDLYVYETNPADPNQYRYDGHWEDMRVIEEAIRVKGADPVIVELKYTRHGPVVFEDSAKQLAYALRPAWMEIGGAPYLASLRMDQATTWEEFRNASDYSNIPGENMVWADRDGNIGWQAVGIAPIRRNFSGMVPVPGDGRYEWDGYLPIKAKPHELNPSRGYIETSNSNYTPPDYPHMDAIGYTWADPYRWARASEFLESGRKLNMMDMIRLQHDYLSIPARTIVPLLEDVTASDAQVEEARRRLLDWDYILDKNSIEAGIYVAFERALHDDIEKLKIPASARDYLRIGMKRMIDFLLAPDGDFGDDPIRGRDEFLLSALAGGIRSLREKLGPDMNRWVYGQPDYKHALIRHPLSPAVDAATRERLDVGPLPRGGNGFTVGNTGGGDNQTSGASFRIFVDTRDWDNTLGMNTPGQVGTPIARSTTISLSFGRPTGCFRPSTLATRSRAWLSSASICGQGADYCGTCPLNPAPPSAPTLSPPRSAKAAWARCIEGLLVATRHGHRLASRNAVPAVSADLARRAMQTWRWVPGLSRRQPGDRYRRPVIHSPKPGKLRHLGTAGLAR